MNTTPQDQFPIHLLNTFVILVLIVLLGWLYMDKSESLDDEEIIATVRAEIAEGDSVLAATIEANAQAPVVAQDLDVTIQAMVNEHGDTVLTEVAMLAPSNSPSSTPSPKVDVSVTSTVVVQNTETVDMEAEATIIAMTASVIFSASDTPMPSATMIVSPHPTTDVPTKRPRPSSTPLPATNTPAPSPFPTNVSSSQSAELIKLNEGSQSIRKLSGLGEGTLIDYAYDGETLALVELLGDTVILIDADSGEEIATLAGFTSVVKDIAWSPVGDLIAAGSSSGEIIVWNEEIPYSKFSVQDTLQGIAWSTDGQQLAAISFAAITIWDVDTNKQVTSFDLTEETGYTIAWSDTQLAYTTNRHIVWAELDDSELIIIEQIEYDDELSLFNQQIAWSPNGQYLAITHNNRHISIWVDGQLVRELTGNRNDILDITWSADSRYIVAAIADRTVNLWNVENGTRLYELNLIFKAQGISWSPEGQEVAIHTDDILLWDVSDLFASQ